MMKPWIGNDPKCEKTEKKISDFGFYEKKFHLKNPKIGFSGSKYNSSLVSTSDYISAMIVQFARAPRLSSIVIHFLSIY